MADLGERCGVTGNTSQEPACGVWSSGLRQHLPQSNSLLSSIILFVVASCTVTHGTDGSGEASAHVLKACRGRGQLVVLGLLLSMPLTTCDRPRHGDSARRLVTTSARPSAMPWQTSRRPEYARDPDCTEIKRMCAKFLTRLPGQPSRMPAELEAQARSELSNTEQSSNQRPGLRGRS